MFVHINGLHTSIHQLLLWVYCFNILTPGILYRHVNIFEYISSNILSSASAYNKNFQIAKYTLNYGMLLILATCLTYSQTTKYQWDITALFPRKYATMSPIVELLRNKDIETNGLSRIVSSYVKKTSFKKRDSVYFQKYVNMVHKISWPACHVRRLAPLLFEGRNVSDITALKAKSVRRGELFLI